MFKNTWLILCVCVSNVSWGMENPSREDQNRNNSSQIVLNLIAALHLHQDIMDILCCEQSSIECRFIPEIYNYFLAKFEKKAQSDPDFLKQIVKELKDFKEIEDGKRVRTVLTKNDDFPALERFFNFLFGATRCYTDVNKMFPRDVSSPARFLRFLDLVFDQEGFFKSENVIVFDSHNREMILSKVFDYVAARNKKSAFLKNLMKGIERAVLPEPSKKSFSLPEDPDARLKSLCCQYHIPQNFKGTQEDAFVLMQNNILDREKQERCSVVLSQQDRLKNLVAAMYEVFYKHSFQEELQKGAKDKQAILQEASLDRHVILQQELMQQFDFLKEDINRFAKLVSEPNVKILEKTRSKKEQRVTCNEELKDDLSIHVLEDSQGQFLDRLQNQCIARKKELLSNDRKQRRALRRAQTTMCLDKASFLKAIFNNKFGRYAVGRRDVACQTESEEKCLCTQEQLQKFSYETWLNIAVKEECVCFACNGLRKVLKDSDDGNVVAQMTEQELFLSRKQALSLYNYFGSSARSNVGF